MDFNYCENGFSLHKENFIIIMGAFLFVIVVVLLIIVASMIWKNKYHENYSSANTYLASTDYLYINSNGNCVTPTDAIAVGWKLTNNASNFVAMAIRAGGPSCSDIQPSSVPGVILTGDYNLARGQTLVCNDSGLVNFYGNIPALYQNCQVQIMNMGSFTVRSVNLPSNIQDSVSITVIDDYTDPSGVNVQFS